VVAAARSEGEQCCSQDDRPFHGAQSRGEVVWMPNDLHLLASDLSRMSQQLGGRDALGPALNAVGLMAKKVAPAATAGDLGGDARFSGWARVGPLGVRYTIHRDGRGVTIHRDRKSAG